HEELREGRMGGVRGRVVEDDLGVAGHLEPAPPARAVPQAEAAQLEVGGRDDGDVEGRLDPFIQPRDGHHAGPVAHPVARRGALHGLVAERPERAALEVADIEEEAVRVLRAVGAPGGEREAVPAREAAPRPGDEHGVAAVREETRVGRGVVEAAERRQYSSRTSAGNSRTMALSAPWAASGRPFTVTLRSGRASGEVTTRPPGGTTRSPETRTRTIFAPSARRLKSSTP